VTTAVVPVAGRGTRLRPATRALPKEMLPVGGKPVVQHIIEELVANGIDRVVFVTAPGKEAIEAHFEGEYPGITFSSVVQPAPRGLGDAVLTAEALVADRPFAVALGDAILGTRETPPVVGLLGRALVDADAACVIAVRDVPRSLTGRFGIVVADDAPPGRPARVRAIVEKPSPAQAPGTLAVSARYAMTPAIFDALRRTPIGPAGELELTDAIARLVQSGAKVLALRLDDVPRHDIGTHEGYARAFMAFALTDPDYGEALRRAARDLLGAG
jgi:UTP--glucose-1-phosphate uridylyltransferase